MDDKKAKIVINESHRLLPAQKGLIEAQGWEADIVGIPAAGLDWYGQFELADELVGHNGPVVFASPVPVLLGRTSALAAARLLNGVPGPAVFVFSNDRREAVEVDGWMLVRIV